MMKVNRNNYEVWMIDYFDGKLNAIETDSLLTFLELNPDLKEEFELFDTTPLDIDNIKFVNKRSLKKREIIAVGEIREENYENFFIAFYENDLTERQNQLLEEFRTRNPQLEKEFLIHQDLFLTADRSVIFENKESIKREQKIAVYWWSAAAAVIILLFGWFSTLQHDNKNILFREALSVNRIQPAHTNLKTIEEPTISVQYQKLHPAVFLKPQNEHQEREVFSTFTMSKRSPDLYLTNVTGHEIIEPEKFDYPTTYALAELNSSPKKKSALGRIIKNLAGRATGNLPSGNNKDKNVNDPAFVKLLDQSITVFNTITGSDTELAKSYDENGNLTHYQMEGETISWSKDYSQSSNAE